MVRNCSSQSGNKDSLASPTRWVSCGAMGVPQLPTGTCSMLSACCRACSAPKRQSGPLHVVARDPGSISVAIVPSEELSLGAGRKRAGDMGSGGPCLWHDCSTQTFVQLCSLFIKENLTLTGCLTSWGSFHKAVCKPSVISAHCSLWQRQMGQIFTNTEVRTRVEFCRDRKSKT